jgi:hypothetical protein
VAVIRALIGDLAVATVELQAMPSPPSANGPERFARLYQHGYKLFLLAVEVGVTRAVDREVVEVEMIAPLVEAFEGTMLLYQLCTGLEDAFVWRRSVAPHTARSLSVPLGARAPRRSSARCAGACRGDLAWRGRPADAAVRACRGSRRGSGRHAGDAQVVVRARAGVTR